LIGANRELTIAEFNMLCWLNLVTLPTDDQWLRDCLLWLLRHLMRTPRPRNDLLLSLQLRATLLFTDLTRAAVCRNA